MNHEDTRSSDSTDAKVTQDLIETLVDGQNGYTQAADKMSGDERPDLAARFRDLASERQQMADDLRSMAGRYGDHVDSDGSALAGIHRGWMGLKDALTGTDADAVINAAINGEEHAVSEFEKALDEDVSAGLRSKIETQLASIRAAKQELESLTTTNG